MANFFTSSIGKKLTMSFAGLFLVVFLLVHLGINLTLILCSDPNIYNTAANFMASNIAIKVFEVFLFAGLLGHIIYALVLQIQNWISRPVGYAKTNYSQTSFFSKYMIHTAIVILIFLVLHFIDFYFKMKIFHGAQIMANGKEDVASLVIEKFKVWYFVVIYIVCFLLLGFHLLHAFQSAFQTMGLYHKRYTPVIKCLGYIYVFIVVAGYSSIALVIYFTKN
jgi:succinate dehydrogenase / fumarate reductase, cytochrome b subunit